MTALWAAALIVLVASGGLPPSEKDWRVMHPAPNPPLALQLDMERRFGEPAESVPVWIEAGGERTLLETAWIIRDRLDDAAASLPPEPLYPVPEDAARRLTMEILPPVGAGGLG